MATKTNADLRILKQLYNAKHGIKEDEKKDEENYGRAYYEGKE